MGGILIGGSFIISSFFMTPMVVAVVWGGMFGTGLACCFASVTPAAMKWFPAQRRGLVAGVVVTGIGLSALFISPLVNFVAGKGVAFAFLICGVIQVTGIVFLSRLVVNPPNGNDSALTRTEGNHTPWYAILKTRHFYILWLMFCLTSVAGLTFATHLDRIVRVQASFDKGYLMVSLFALFNAGGRLLAGYLSDRLGRRKAMTVNFSVMTLVLFFTIGAGTAFSLALSVSFLGLSYGGIYSLFPAATSSFFGERNFGLNYGMIFTALGVAGTFPLITGHLFDQQGNFTFALLLLSVFSAIAVGLSMFLKEPQHLKMSPPGRQSC
jgi:OFA family oxalate/formate antiporter-like MFS transporter